MLDNFEQIRIRRQQIRFLQEANNYTAIKSEQRISTFKHF